MKEVKEGHKEKSQQHKWLDEPTENGHSNSLDTKTQHMIQVATSTRPSKIKRFIPMNTHAIKKQQQSSIVWTQYIFQ